MVSLQGNLARKPGSRSAICILGAKMGLLRLLLGACKVAASDVGQDYIELAQLFAAAYAPYVLPPCLILIALVAAWLPGLDIISIMWTNDSVFRLVLMGCACLVATLFAACYKLRPLPCYLVDFNCISLKDERKLPMEVSHFLTHCSDSNYKIASKRNLLFQLKIFLKSGLGEETYGPSFLYKNVMPCMALGVEETDHMMFGALDGLFTKTGLRPCQVDILIANIGLFYPVPSLSSRVVNRYKMREDVRCFNISGMGCAASSIAIDLAKDLLRVHKNKYIVIVSTEALTTNWYSGNDRSMMVPNCLFRCGSCALLLTNIHAEKVRSKLELLKSFRTTTAAKDDSYNVIVEREDEDGNVGTSLSMKLLDVASQAIWINMAKLVPSMMPASELLKVAIIFIQKSVFKKKLKAYMPDFKKAFTHFCLHPGGRAVIDGLGENLGLSEYDMESAKMALHRFGNTSSSGLWYAMAYLEAKERLKKGEKVWQVALGSGFKCNSVVWKVLKDACPVDGCNPWMDVIHRYPVKISTDITPSHPYYEVVKKGEIIVREEEEEAKRKREQNSKGLHEQKKVDTRHAHV